jgi:hypothetical protein
MYCEDRSSKTPRKQGQVFQSLSAIYSYQDLRKMKLWSKLAAKAKAKQMPHCRPGS